jgi:hypothetical protein
MANPEPVVKPVQYPSTARELAALREAISPARLTTYMRHAHGNARQALELYAWNMRAAAALHPILHANEVALRNAVNRALESQFGAQWPYSQGFLRTLPAHERATFEGNRRKLEKTRGVQRLSTGDVVAGQTYYFWVSMLTSRFEQRVWQREFARSFPFAPPHIGRAVMHASAESIRLLRNRIAHHEPLLDYHLVGAYRRALTMIRWISPEKAAWAVGRWPAPETLHASFRGAAKRRAPQARGTASIGRRATGVRPLPA